MAPPLVREAYGPYDGHNRQPGAAKHKKQRGNRLARRASNRYLWHQRGDRRVW